MSKLINTTKWKEFKYETLFTIERGKGPRINNITIGSTPFITATETNNGLTRYVDFPAVHKGNCITVNRNGSIAQAFYQTNDFCSTEDVHIFYLKPFILNKNIALFLITLIKKEKYRFGYGRKWSIERMKKSTIKLPADSNGIPDWEYMENYIKELWKTKIPNLKEFRQPKNKVKVKLKPVLEWQEFKLKDIFEVKGTKTTPFETLSLSGEGHYPYITTKAVNNGVSGYFNFFTEEKNVLTIDSAVLGYCSYQKEKFSASDHVEKLILKDRKLNSPLALFLVTLINLERPRYSYGRKFSQKRIKETTIRLPVDFNGTPDWEYMENYIKSLSYSNKI